MLTKLQYFTPTSIHVRHIDAPVREVILMGRWPQAGKCWTSGACLVRVTTGPIAWRWYLSTKYRTHSTSTLPQCGKVALEI